MLRFRSLWLLSFALSFAATPAEAQTVLFSDDFENGTANWTTELLWHLTDESAPCHDASFPSGSQCMWYGNEGTCTFEGLIIDQRALALTTPIALPTGGDSPVLEFWSRTEVEPATPAWDARWVDISTDGGAQWSHLYLIEPPVEPWTIHSVSLEDYAGQTILLRFSFRAVDGNRNKFLGWLVDDVVVTTSEEFPTSCFGVQNACPCSNHGDTGRGCSNSAGPGALLTVSGATHPDTILLQSSGELPNALTIFLQGSISLGPVDFGDGLRCAGGPLKRLYVRNASGGVAIVPGLGDPTVSERATALGDVLDPGSRRYYQAYYRDPTTKFCPPPQGANFNASQMRRITW
jgi:hypothetical protein